MAPRASRCLSTGTLTRLAISRSLARHLQAVLDRLGGTAGIDQGGDLFHQQVFGHMEEELGDRLVSPGLLDIRPVFSERGQIVAGRLVVGMVVQPVVQLLVVVAGPSCACFQMFWVGRHDVFSVAEVGGGDEQGPDWTVCRGGQRLHSVRSSMLSPCIPEYRASKSRRARSSNW